MPKKLDARRKENRLMIETRRDGGQWVAEAAGVAASAGRKKAAVKLLKAHFAMLREVGIGPRSNQIITEAYALMRGRTIDGEDRLSLEEAVQKIGVSVVRKTLRRDYSKRLATR